MTRPLKIDLYTDIICPWCLIGARRLNNVLAREFADIAVDIEHHPVLLMPDCPPEGMNTLDLLKSRYGDLNMADFRAHPEAEARKAGLDLDLGKQVMLYPTRDAHTLIRHARARGTQHALAFALITAYFLEGRNINDPDILADIASQHGFERDEVLHLVTSAAQREATRHEAATSARRGVRSVPTFVLNGRPAQPQDEAALATMIRTALLPGTTPA